MSDEMKEHLPIGGGLLLLLLGIVVNILVSSYMIYIYIRIFYFANIDSSFQTMIFLYHGVINITFVLGSLYALYANYYYLKTFRTFMVIFLLASGILNMLPVLFATPATAADSDANGFVLLMSWLPAIVWVPYLLYSPRPKRTYIYDRSNNPWLSK
ncbi:MULTISPECIES: DUF2569 family protein [Brucella/Ochrobactrum group]|jgi:hypothetical protein|nr:DUF2569 family protein [Brucella pseudintermedia]KAB2682166.1 DUF2569 domain-containing protein [Brucella pseudintermedia]NKE75756.1 DUF2569 domain-containing protein [Ochrobactrum sp. MC-1LL]TWH02180.1 uncharacterized protein DUF2569 [Ochrobactrum sp. J50]WPM80528.1 DUF2569 family protein [Brucella pseudintermedia]